MTKRILVSEFSAWHDECLYSACLLLKGEGFYVALALNEDLKTRIGDSLNSVTDEITYFPFKKGLKGTFALLHFWKWVVKGGFTHLFLNSAQGSVAWKFFLLPIPRHIKVFGTIHNLKKLVHSFGQKFITRRIDGYVLLRDLLTQKYKEVCKKPSVAIYPIFYPVFNTFELPKKKDEVWILIPGAVSLARRDYLSLLPSGVKYAPHIKFIILGNKNKADGKEICEKVYQANMKDNFLFFEGFVPENEFYSYVLQCDYIMPLIHPGCGEYAKYVTEKISGTYNLAIAYRKIMLCPDEMRIYEDFRDSAMFYSLKELHSFINSLTPIENDIFYTHSKWDVQEQQRRMAFFLEKI